MSLPMLESCIQYPIDDKTLLEVVPKAKDWALMHGAAMRSKNNFSPDALNVSFLQYKYDVIHLGCILTCFFWFF